MNIGLKIKEIRELRNFTQEHMAERLGISQVSYSRIENEQTKLDLKRFHDIARILEIDPSLILNFDKSKIFDKCQQCDKSYYSTYALNDLERIRLLDRIGLLEIEIEKLRNRKG
ncbi:MAG: helix-turn-helix transcriptional regulator [Bacteroidales bacterium]|nr:helix-turn-helix transcriptional regulator [Bacteroidales bacterium]